MRERKRHTHPASKSGAQRAQQAPAAGSSVGDIVNRHTPGTPIGNPMATRQPRFINMPSQSFHEMLNQVTDVQMQFGSLSARLKGKFNNSPYTMLRWLEVPENRPEALKLGLVVPTPEEAQALAVEAAKARRTEQVDVFREALKPDPEAQPDYKPKGGNKKEGTPS